MSSFYRVSLIFILFCLLSILGCVTRPEPIKEVHIQGTVMISGGSPAIEATVFLEKNLSRLMTIRMATTTTDSLGHYEFNHRITSGDRLHVWASKVDYYCWVKYIEMGENLQIVDLILHPFPFLWDSWPYIVHH